MFQALLRGVVENANHAAAAVAREVSLRVRCGWPTGVHIQLPAVPVRSTTSSSQSVFKAVWQFLALVLATTGRAAALDDLTGEALRRSASASASTVVKLPQLEHVVSQRHR